jgi:hypothetical protein
VQDNAAQTEEVARYLKINDSTLTVVQKFVRKCPTGNKYKSRLVRLPLMHQIAAGQEGAPTLVQALENAELRLGQGDKGTQLAR